MSGHSGRAHRRQRVGGYHSRFGDPEWSWFSESDLHVHASVSSASYCFRSWPDRWFVPDPPRLQGNLLCRKDWIQLRRSALSQWVFFLVQEVAAYSWCSGCEHLRSGTWERWTKWAHVGWSPWHLCVSKVDGPCAGCPDSISDSESEHWEWGPRRCGSPRDVTSPDAIPHLDIHFVHALWNLCAPSAFWLRIQQQRSFNDAGCHAVGGRGSGRGVCLCKPPSP